MDKNVKGKWRRGRAPFSGPLLVPAQVTKVYDADTIYVDASIWPKNLQNTGVRVAGVDTPEKRGTGCRRHPLWRGKQVPDQVKQYENELGLRATDFVKERIKPGDWILISHIKPDKYHGRVVGRVHYAPDVATLKACTSYPFDLSRCPSIGAKLLSEGHAVSYDGGTKAAWWCEGSGLYVLPKAKPEGRGE